MSILHLNNKIIDNKDRWKGTRRKLSFYPHYVDIKNSEFLFGVTAGAVTMSIIFAIWANIAIHWHK